VDNFFDKVMVMAENEAVRKKPARAASELLREFSTMPIFSELGGESKI